MLGIPRTKSAVPGLLASIGLALLCSCFDSSSGPGAPPLSNDADLKSMVITADDGTIPGLSFSPAVVSYQAIAAYRSTSLTVTAIPADSGASVAGAGEVAFSSTSVGISIVVTAEDGVTEKTYSISVVRQEPRTIADLSGLTVSPGALEPAFSPSITSYSAYLGNDQDSVTIGATAEDADGASMDGEGSFPLAEGANTLSVTVTAQDGLTKKTYKITAYRAIAPSSAPSANAYLKSLTATEGALSPVFAYDAFDYDIVVPNDVATISLTAEPADSGASVEYSPANPLSLSAGQSTEQAITVTPASGPADALTYRVSVGRAAEGASSAATLSDIVLHGIDLNDQDATISYTGGSGAYSATVDYEVIKAYLYSCSIPGGATLTTEGGDLGLGSNAFIVTVTAADGATTSAYTFTITRSAASAQASIDPAFENATLSGSAMTVAGTATTGVAGIRGRVVGPDCPTFTADVSGGAWTAHVDVSATTNGPKILMVYPVDLSGRVVGGISYIPVAVANESGGGGSVLSGTLAFADAAPSGGTVIISASPVASEDDEGNYALDPPVAMVVKDLGSASYAQSFTLTGLVAGDYLVEAVYYPVADDYCVVPERYGSSGSVLVEDDASLEQSIVLF